MGFDIIDENDTLIGQTADYETVHAKGLWHRGAHVLLYTEDRKVVVQQRSTKLSIYPGLYEVSVGGGVDAGESPENAAIREVHEELGIQLTPDDLTFVGTYKVQESIDSYVSNAILYIYKSLIPETTAFTIDLDETQNVRFVPIDVIEQAMANGNQLSFGTLVERDYLWRYMLAAIK